MTDIDTAAIRAECESASPVMVHPEVAVALCDALDAAQARADELAARWASEAHVRKLDVADLEARAEAAEARATAAEAERDELKAAITCCAQNAAAVAAVRALVEQWSWCVDMALPMDREQVVGHLRAALDSAGTPAEEGR